MTTEALQDFFEGKDFRVHLSTEGSDQCAELETWTAGGVNMLVWLRPFTPEEFSGYVRDFDVDGQIDTHRQDPSYKANFTISRSVKDFADFHDRLKETAEALKEKVKEAPSYEPRTKITHVQMEMLQKAIYDSLISSPDMGLGEIGECEDEAKRIVGDWMQDQSVGLTGLSTDPCDWQSLSIEEARGHGHFQPEEQHEKAIAVLVMDGCWIQKIDDHTFYTYAGMDSKEGSFFACVKLIEENV